MEAVCELMRNQDLILVAQKCCVVIAFHGAVALPGRLSTRLQPDHPTGDAAGIAASLLDGLLFGLLCGSGDAVVGINRATYKAAQVIRLVGMLDEIVQS